MYAVTNPEEAAPQDIWTAFTSFFESLWNPSTNPDGSTVQKAGMSYVYDEDGTLIAQTLTGGAQNSWGQSARYVYLPTASGPMPVAAIYGTKHYAIQSDHLNTPRRLIQSDGQVAWQWAYSAFGDEKPTTAKTRFANTELNQSFGTTTVPAVTFNLRYPGQYFDQESNLHYNYHRSYSATVGRYTQADPIGLDGGWNRFGYVGGDAVNEFDPDGLVKWTGSFRVFNASIGKKIGRVPLRMGRNEITLDLESECINNKKVVVTLRVVNPDDSRWDNLPIEFYGSGSVEMNDNQSSPNGALLQGDFAMRLSGAGVGFGGSISSGLASGGFKRFGGIFFGKHNFTGRSQLLFPPKEVNCEC